MHILRRKLRLSVNPDIVDRSVSEPQLYTEGWNNVELTPEQLINSIKKSHPYCAQLRGYRDKKHFWPRTLPRWTLTMA